MQGRDLRVLSGMRRLRQHPGMDNIYEGAMDRAADVATMIAVARAAAKAG